MRAAQPIEVIIGSGSREAAVLARLQANGVRALTFKGPAMEVRWLRRKPKGPVAVPILPGACLGMRRDVFRCVKVFGH